MKNRIILLAALFLTACGNGNVDSQDTGLKEKETTFVSYESTVNNTEEKTTSYSADVFAIDKKEISKMNNPNSLKMCGILYINGRVYTSIGEYSYDSSDKLKDILSETQQGEQVYCNGDSLWSVDKSMLDYCNGEGTVYYPKDYDKNFRCYISYEPKTPAGKKSLAVYQCLEGVDMSDGKRFLLDTLGLKLSSSIHNNDIEIDVHDTLMKLENVEKGIVKEKYATDNSDYLAFYDKNNMLTELYENATEFVYPCIGYKDGSFKYLYIVFEKKE